MNKKALEASLALWRRRHRWNLMMRERARKRGDEKAARRYGTRLGQAVNMINRRKQQLADIKPLREKAYEQAVKLIGVMEQGGNNHGPQVEQIIREGGGQADDSWCGWFVAACYRRAGSKSVVWQWGAVRLLYPLVGIKRVTKPERGDLVRFTFDHVGMFVAWCNSGGTVVPMAQATHIISVEGNTGASGAVSDSKTGGDGVYRKIRARELVNDYLRVTR